ncbi:hypothetical protein MBANPS3_004133 [Mucor bainieri]
MAVVGSGSSSEEIGDVPLGDMSMADSSIPDVVQSTDADSDIEMSESVAHTVDNAEASLVDGMDSVSVSEEDVIQDIAAQELHLLLCVQICVSLVVQNVVCSGIVDTGATF